MKWLFPRDGPFPRAHLGRWPHGLSKTKPLCPLSPCSRAPFSPVPIWPWDFSPCHFALPSQEIVLVWYKLGSASYRLGLCSVSQDHKCQRLKYSYLMILKQSDKGSPYLRSIQDNKYQFKNICPTFLFLLTLVSCN